MSIDFILAVLVGKWTRIGSCGGDVFLEFGDELAGAERSMTLLSAGISWQTGDRTEQAGPLTETGDFPNPPILNLGNLRCFFLLSLISNTLKRVD